MMGRVCWAPAIAALGYLAFVIMMFLSNQMYLPTTLTSEDAEAWRKARDSFMAWAPGPWLRLGVDVRHRWGP
jgi:hypothetical protein